MLRKNHAIALLAGAALVAAVSVAEAKDKVKVGFIGPLTGGMSGQRPRRPQFRRSRGKAPQCRSKGKI